MKSWIHVTIQLSSAATAACMVAGRKSGRDGGSRGVAVRKEEVKAP